MNMFRRSQSGNECGSKLEKGVKKDEDMKLIICLSNPENFFAHKN